MDELLKLALGSPTAALGLALFALAVMGAGTYVFLRGLRADINGIGGKVGGLATQAALDQQRMGRIESDHAKLEAEFRASQKELPELLKQTRHEIADGKVGQLITAVDERVDIHDKRLDRIEQRLDAKGERGA